MMNLAEYRNRNTRLADFLPWVALVGEGIVLNKDGSLQRTARFRGPDLDSATPAELIATTIQDLRDCLIGTHRRADRLTKEISLRAEVVVQQSRIHSCSSRDRAHRRSVVPVITELGDGGSNDPLACIRLARPRPPAVLAGAAPTLGRHPQQG